MSKALVTIAIVHSVTKREFQVNKRISGQLFINSKSLKKNMEKLYRIWKPAIFIKQNNLNVYYCDSNCTLKKLSV